MKLRLRLKERAIRGMNCPYPRINLHVRDRHGTHTLLPFRIDTGADCCAMPVSLARKEAIPFQDVQSGTAAGLVGAAQKFHDRLRVVIGGRTYDWPCDFIDVPPPSAGRRPDPLLRIPVLGRAGFLDDFAVAIDSGYLILTRLGPLRRLVRKGLHGVWQTLGMIRPGQESL
jgi:hypothetical protein